MGKTNQKGHGFIFFSSNFNVNRTNKHIKNTLKSRQKSITRLFKFKYFGVFYTLIYIGI